MNQEDLVTREMEEDKSKGEIQNNAQISDFSGRCVMLPFYSAREYRKEINFGSYIMSSMEGAPGSELRSHLVL